MRDVADALTTDPCQSNEAIAKRFSVSASFVASARKRLGFPTCREARRRDANRRSRPLPAHWQKVKELTIEYPYATDESIAKAVGIKRQLVGFIRKKLGFQSSRKVRTETKRQHIIAMLSDDPTHEDEWIAAALRVEHHVVAACRRELGLPNSKIARKTVRMIQSKDAIGRLGLSYRRAAECLGIRPQTIHGYVTKAKIFDLDDGDDPRLATNETQKLRVEKLAKMPAMMGISKKWLYYLPATLFDHIRRGTADSLARDPDRMRLFDLPAELFDEIERFDLRSRREFNEAHELADIVAKDQEDSGQLRNAVAASESYHQTLWWARYESPLVGDATAVLRKEWESRAEQVQYQWTDNERQKRLLGVTKITGPKHADKVHVQLVSASAVLSPHTYSHFREGVI